MGYCTNFELNIEDGDIDISVISKRLTQITKYTFGYDGTLYHAKWYDWKDDMRKLSSEYHDIVFVLSGQGEEYGDIWKAYFKNGKMQYAAAIVTFEPFDEGKLK